MIKIAKIWFDKTLPVLFFLVMISIFIPLGYASGNIKAGSGSFVFDDKYGNKDKPVTVWYYYPKEANESTPILFAIHGVTRQGQRMRNAWVSYAKKLKLIVLAPEFTKEAYPHFNEGNFRGSMSDSKSSFVVVEGIFDYVKSITGNVSGQYYIYGHSAGGQFVHRLVILNPESRVKMAIAANAGWYTMPDFSIGFPYGLKNSEITEDNLKDSFQKRLIVLLGEEDTDEHHKELRRTPKAMQQGKQRFERGHKFYETAEKEADNLAVKLNWTLKTVPGVAHNNPKMVVAAAEVLSQYLETQNDNVK